jgi:hypothetical protein
MAPCVDHKTRITYTRVFAGLQPLVCKIVSALTEYFSKLDSAAAVWQRYQADGSFTPRLIQASTWRAAVSSSSRSLPLSSLGARPVVRYDCGPRPCAGKGGTPPPADNLIQHPGSRGPSIFWLPLYMRAPCLGFSGVSRGYMRALKFCVSPRLMWAKISVLPTGRGGSRCRQPSLTRPPLLRRALGGQGQPAFSSQTHARPPADAR